MVFFDSGGVEMLSLSNMREGGVYVLPDGRRLIATHDHRGGYFLYAPQVWSAFRGWGPAEYDVMPEGPIVTCEGQRTPWDVGDLTDTGETERTELRYYTDYRQHDRALLLLSPNAARRIVSH
jgi:hypothetical protein